MHDSGSLKLHRWGNYVRQRSKYLEETTLKGQKDTCQRDGSQKGSEKHITILACHRNASYLHHKEVICNQKTYKRYSTQYDANTEKSL